MAFGGAANTLETIEARQRFLVFLPVGCRFAGHDIIDMADGESLNLHSTTPGIGESLDAIRGKNQIQIERIRKRVSNGRRAAASNSASQSGGIVACDSAL